MTERTVHCKMLNKELPGMAFQTYPGELGKRIFDNFSQEAWQTWMDHQTMLINEHSPQVFPNLRQKRTFPSRPQGISGGPDQLDSGGVR